MAPLEEIIIREVRVPNSFWVAPVRDRRHLTPEIRSVVRIESSLSEEATKPEFSVDMNNFTRLKRKAVVAVKVTKRLCLCRLAPWSNG